MTRCDLGSLTAAQTLTGDIFVVAPADLTAHAESAFLGAIVGSCEECLTTASITGGDAGGWGRLAPADVVVARAIAAIQRALPGVQVTVRDVGRVRVRREALVGEPLEVSARVRARSRWRPDLHFMTLDALVRGQGGEVLRFELAVEVQAVTAAPADAA